MRLFFRFSALALLFAGTIEANLRAPVHIERGLSRLMAKPAKIELRGERLAFRCPASYTGKPNHQAFAAGYCTGTVTYFVAPQVEENVSLAFVYSGGEQVEWSSGAAKALSRARVLEAADTSTCRFCPDEMRAQRVAEAELPVKTTSREINVVYQQALDYDERGHGYFSDGNWSQGFTYELWPLAEWRWQQKIVAELLIQIAARPGFLGIGHKNDQLHCEVRTGERGVPVAMSPGEIIAGERHYTARIELQKQPQRLHCYWSAK